MITALFIIHTIGMIATIMWGSILFFQNPDSYVYLREELKRERITGKRLLIMSPVWEIVAFKKILSTLRAVRSDEIQIAETERLELLRETERIIKSMKEDERREWERRFRGYEH